MLSMDFGTRSIKIVEGNFKKGSLNISNTFSIDLPNGIYEDGYIKDMNGLREIMDSGLRFNNVKRGETIAVVDSSEILTREIFLPNVAPDEIEGIIKYKISDYIPIDLEDYIVQYINQGVYMEGGNEKVKLFIIAMPKHLIISHLDILKDLDLKPKVLDIKSNAIRKLLHFSEKKNKDIYIEKSTIANIDIGFSNTKLTILKDKNIKISRVIPIGIKSMLENLNSNLDLSERELMEEILTLKNIDDKTYEISVALKTFLIKLFENLDMVFRYYNSLEVNNNIDLILLQGIIVKSEHIKNQFQEYLNIKSVRIDYLKGILNENLYIYSNAVGSLIRGDI